MNITFYQDAITSGAMTLEEAQAKTAEAFKKKLELEAMGYYLSPNKTDGVMLYDWKSAIKESYQKVASVAEPESLYTKNKIEVLIPNVYDNYFADKHKKANKANCSHLIKSALATTVIDDAIKFGVGDIGTIKKMMPDQVDSITAKMEDYKSGWVQSQDIESVEDILELISHTEKGEIMGIHIAKMKTPGMMKPRWVVVDALVDGKQVLYCYEKEGAKSIHR